MPLEAPHTHKHTQTWHTYITYTYERSANVATAPDVSNITDLCLHRHLRVLLLREVLLWPARRRQPRLRPPWHGQEPCHTYLLQGVYKINK